MKKIAIPALAVLAAAAAANVAYDESISGDLSNDGFTPTALGTLALGSNRVLGTLETQPDINPDYFTFEIAVGQQLVAIVLEQYSPNSGEEQQSFIALQAGPQVTSDFDTSVFLGATLIGALPGSAQGDDVLDDLGSPLFGGQGFTGPLGPGVYSVWFQETAEGISYALDLQVTPIPAPAAALGLAGLALIRPRRR
jgi:hypothetical protein